MIERMYEAALAEPRRAGEYETALCDALLEILSRKIHDLPGILSALDASDVQRLGVPRLADRQQTVVLGVEIVESAPDCCPVGAPDCCAASPARSAPRPKKLGKIV